MHYYFQHLFSALRSKSSARHFSPQKILKLESLEDRRLLSSTLTVGLPSGKNNFPTITAALQAASANTVIEVFPGIYHESVSISQKNLQLIAEGNGVEIQPLSVTPSSTIAGSFGSIGGAAIDIYGAGVVVKGFVVDGSADTDGNLWTGIRVIDGGSATIEDNTVQGITQGSLLSNIGVDVGLSQVAGMLGHGSATVNDNTIFGYEGAGVLVDGGGANATIEGNSISGVGTGNGGVVQYGVQVSNGAIATVTNNTINNNTVAGNASSAPYSPNPSSAGIFFLNDSNKSVATKNIITGNDDGVLVQNSSSVEVSSNAITGNFGYAGVFVLTSNAVQVTGNVIFNNLTDNGIALNYSSGVVVQSNKVSNTGTFPSSSSTGSASDGIFDFSGSDNTIQGNDSRDNSGNGINIDSTFADKLVGNTVINNSLNGFQDVDGSHDNFSLGNSSNNALDGLLLIDTSSDSVLLNLLSPNNSYGVELQGCHNTLIAFNVVSGNKKGSITQDSATSGTNSYFNA